MNQTEIPNILANAENNNDQNRLTSQYTRIAPKITILKGTTQTKIYQTSPKFNNPINSKPDQARLPRVSSSKGIRVLSKQKSTQRIEVTEFKTDRQISETFMTDRSQKRSAESETSIKISRQEWRASERSIQKVRLGLEQKMRRQLLVAISKYEEKMNQQLSYQYNTYKIEVQKLEKQLQENKVLLRNRQIQINDLKERIINVEDKVLQKLDSLQTQLIQHKDYSEKCNQYTIKRISEVQFKSSQYFQQIQTITNPHSQIQCWQKLESAYNFVKNIGTQYARQNSAIKMQAEEEINQLQIQLGTALTSIEELDLKMIDLLQEYIRTYSWDKSLTYLYSAIEDKIKYFQEQEKQNKELMNIFEIKFQEVLKKVNKTSIQVQLTKGMRQMDEGDSQKVLKLQKQIQIKEDRFKSEIAGLQKELYEIQAKHQEQIDQMENKTISKISFDELKKEVASKEKNFIKKQKELNEKIKELEKKINYYEVKYNESTKLEINLQTTLAEAYSQAIVKQKTKEVEESKSAMISEYQTKVKQLKVQISQLDRQNYLLAQKLANISNEESEMKKLATQLDLSAKNIKQLLQENHQLKQQIKNSKILINQQQQELCTTRNSLARISENKFQLEAQLKQLKTQLENTKKENSKLTSKILSMNVEETNENQQEYEQLAGKYTKKQLLEHIETLEAQLQELSEENIEIKDQNHRLQENLNEYAETFQKQSINFRNAIENLQKEKNQLQKQVTFLNKENSQLKSSLSECPSSTKKSFFEGSVYPSEMSTHLMKKTCSTEGINQGHEKLMERKLSHREMFPKKSNPQASKMPQSLEKVKELEKELLLNGNNVPALCSLDKNRNLVSEVTGKHLRDRDGNKISLDEEQLHQAVSLGIILL